MHVADLSRSRRPAWHLGGAVFRVMLVLAVPCLALAWMAWPSLQGHGNAAPSAAAAAQRSAPPPATPPKVSVSPLPQAPAPASPVTVVAATTPSADPAPPPPQAPPAQPAPKLQQGSQGPLTVYFPQGSRAPQGTQAPQPPQGSQPSQAQRPPFVVEAAKPADVRAAPSPVRPPAEAPPATAVASAVPNEAPAASPRPPSGAIDLNSASVEQLNALPGAGQVGRAIVRGRPYASTEELVTKRILRRSVYEQIKDQVTAR